MKKIGKLIFAISLFFCGTVFSSTPQVSVQATVDQNDVGLGDVVTVTVSVKSNESVDIQDPRVPDIEGFDLVNQFNSNSVRSQFINGSMSHEVIKGFNYALQARKTGTLSIGSFEVIVEGKVYRTQPILIKVSQGGGGRTRPQNGSQRIRPQIPGFGDDDTDPLQQMEEEMFNQLLQRRGLQNPNSAGPGNFGIPKAGPRNGVDPQFRSLPTNPDEAFFIQVEVDKTEVFENEQVTVSWYLYTRGQLESLDRVKFPDLKGFWKEIIEEIPQLQFSEEIINGVVYRKALLASHALFPIKPGTSYVDEYKIKSRVRTQQGYGFGRSYEYTKTSKKVPIKVNPLPQEGRPSSFTGAVGSFDVHAKTESTQFPVNQPFSLKIRFEGTGNAKLIELPAVSWPATLEIYDTKTESKFFKNGTSYKEFEILVIPRKVGSLEIPKIQFSMFNNITKKYETKSTEVINLQIVENPNAATNISQRVSGDTSKAATSVVKDVFPQILMSPDSQDSVQLAQTPFLWTGIFGTVFAILLAKAQSEFGWGRRKKTLKEKLLPKFKKIDAAFKSESFRQVGSETTNAYYFILGELSGQGGGSQEIQKLLNLMPSSLRREYAEPVLKSFEKFQTLAFAPEEMLGSLKSKESLGKNIAEAKDLILKLVKSSEDHTVD